MLKAKKLALVFSTSWSSVDPHLTFPPSSSLVSPFGVLIGLAVTAQISEVSFTMNREVLGVSARKSCGSFTFPGFEVSFISGEILFRKITSRTNFFGKTQLVKFISCGKFLCKTHLVNIISGEILFRKLIRTNFLWKTHQVKFISCGKFLCKNHLVNFIWIKRFRVYQPENHVEVLPS